MERAANGGPAGRGGAERAEGGRCGARGRKMAEPETQLLLGVGLIGKGRAAAGRARKRGTPSDVKRVSWTRRMRR